MPEVTKFQNGQFCWAELATNDTGGGKKFYSELFGWEVVDQDIPGGTYTQFKLGGRDVCALFEQFEEERSQGIPPHWNSYINVDDVDSYTKRAEAAGGSIVAPPFDVMDFGRMAFVADPTGAVFGLWQAKTAIGAEVIGDPNTLAWNELITPDVDKASTFYSEVFGYTAEAMPSEDLPYTLLKLDGVSAAGVMPPRMEGTPPSWLVYFLVDDTAATASKVTELGGAVFVEPTFIPTVGTFAVFADPQGAVFAVVQPDPDAPQQ